MRAFVFAFIVMLGAVGGGCGGDPVKLPNAAPALRDGGRIAVQVVVPKTAGPGLAAAGRDVQLAQVEITGAEDIAIHRGALSGAKTDCVIVVKVGSDVAQALGEQGHRITKTAFAADDRYGLLVEARTEAAAMWGLYRIAHDMGVRYIHPEQTFYPANSGARLPWHYSGKPEIPAFSTRGLHEHTQHPTPPSDFLMRSDDKSFRALAANYIRWLARNRQNTFTFHMLKTVDLDTWVPYYKGIAAEAKDFGLDPGIVVSFADEQQNNFKLIRTDKLDGGGNVLADDKQIRLSLDRLLQTGIGRVTFQIGTSEFTKPTDKRVLDWMKVAVAHLGSKKVRAYIWIHTTCSLHDDKGGYFYHLPLKADPALGAWVHTTMFYDLEHPAPVYDCTSFKQQLDFIKQADGKRELVYFPETAWWLGFDNNMPLALPITGWSRSHDIKNVLSKHQVTGHVTFTTGREWGYWRYDHHVMAATWDRDLDWPAYLASIEAVFGPDGDKVVSVLTKWAELQKKHFYDTNPLIYFYLAGELAQDEIGEQAGVLARRPKLAFHKVLKMDKAAFAKWKKDDYDLLTAMLPAYTALLDQLPQPPETGADMQRKLYAETRRVLRIHVQRIAHALELYGAVIEMRPWHQAVQLANAASPVGTPEVTIKHEAKKAADARIAKAAAITAEVRKTIALQEKDYRYKAELLREKKGKSLTSYKFGYLEQTGTGHFWVRRDEQIRKLADKTFGDFKEAWKNAKGKLSATNSGLTKLVQPDNPVAAGALTGFMPPMLWSFAAKGMGSAGDIDLFVATDRNDNKLPDGESEQIIKGKWDYAQKRWLGQADAFTITIEDAAGNEQGVLSMLNAKFDVQAEMNGGYVGHLKTATVTGNVGSKALLDILFAVGGIDREGASSLIKAIFSLPADKPLPKLLSFQFTFAFEPVK